MSRKRAVALAAFLILIALPFCIYADTTSFMISHSINASAAYYFAFWKTGTTNVITEAAFSSAGNYKLATLGIAYTAAVSFSDIHIDVSNLSYTSNGNTYYCDFTFTVYEPNTTTQIAFDVDENSHGSGSSTLMTNKTFTKYSASTWDTDTIADFVITIDDSNAAAGTYNGTLTFTATTN